MKMLASTTPRIPIGMLMSKIHRQDRYSTISPPSGGPRIGPISAGVVSQAIAATTSLFAAVRISTRRPTGIIIAPPAPWITRANTRNGRLSARPHRIEPSVNTAIASRKMLRPP